MCHTLACDVFTDGSQSSSQVGCAAVSKECNFYIFACLFLFIRCRTDWLLWIWLMVFPSISLELVIYSDTLSVLVSLPVRFSWPVSTTSCLATTRIGLCWLHNWTLSDPYSSSARWQQACWSAWWSWLLMALRVTVVTSMLIALWSQLLMALRVTISLGLLIWFWWSLTTFGRMAAFAGWCSELLFTYAPSNPLPIVWRQYTVLPLVIRLSWRCWALATPFTCMVTWWTDLLLHPSGVTHAVSISLSFTSYSLSSVYWCLPEVLHKPSLTIDSCWIRSFWWKESPFPKQ